MMEISEPGAPLVTVIVPCYNHADYVARTIKSVLDQDYPAIQLLVIDDGSKDRSVTVIEECARERSFDIVVQENRGICRTLNRAVREFARGEWIAVLASDDFWRHDKVRLQIEALQAAPDTRFCFSQACEFHDEANAEQGRVFPGTVQQGNVLDRVFVRQHVPAGTMIFARSLFEELGGFDENLREEDWDFVIRSAAATRFCGVGEPLLYYRAHAGNTMRTAGRRRIFQQKAMILAKNMHLVSPWRWLLAIGFHFAHDIAWSAIRRKA